MLAIPEVDPIFEGVIACVLAGLEITGERTIGDITLDGAGALGSAVDAGL